MDDCANNKKHSHTWYHNKGHKPSLKPILDNNVYGADDGDTAKRRTVSGTGKKEAGEGQIQDLPSGLYWAAAWMDQLRLEWKALANTLPISTRHKAAACDASNQQEMQKTLQSATPAKGCTGARIGTINRGDF